MVGPKRSLKEEALGIARARYSTGKMHFQQRNDERPANRPSRSL